MNVRNQSSRICIALAAILLCGTVSAQTEQIALIGQASPSGSMSASGLLTNAVYLRWEVLEGEVPAHWSAFRILRDGTDITPVPMPVVGIMAPGDIQAMYAGSAQDRRAKETLRWLDELDPTTPLTPLDLGAAIASQLSSDSYWAQAASRIDINVARARYRGFVDTGATATHSYTLVVDTTTGSQDIARVVVDVTAPAVALAPVDFRALAPSELGRCDAPERAKAHATVGLVWDFPTSNPADQLRYTLQVPGFDVYRTTAPVGILPVFNIRALAATATHDTAGRVNLPGLVKVNDQPITISGTPSHCLGYSGWAPSWFHHLETEADLLAAGVNPGDAYGYYVVPRDFTGNYGDTVEALVVVPDLRAPPAPWRVRSFAQPAIAYGTDAMVIRWPQVDVRNFLADRGDRRTICNLSHALSEKRVRFTSSGQCSGDAAMQEYDLHVTQYLVYRFESAGEAQGFVDSDGDGYGDLDERSGDATDPTFSCNPSIHPGGAVSYRVATVPASSAVVRSTGRQDLEFADLVPAATPGKVFWYRIVARTASGQLSEMSAPVRAHFPDYIGPTRDAAGEICLGRCAYSTHFTNEHSALLGYDTTGDARYIRYECNHAILGPQVAVIPVASLSDTLGIAVRHDSVCEGLVEGCSQQDVTVTYFDGGGRRLASVVRKDWNADCSKLETELNKTCSQLQKLEPGEVVDDEVYLDAPGFIEGEHCLSLYREINGTTYRLETICEDVFPLLLEPDRFGSTTVCLSASIRDSNNRVSPSTRLPCFQVGQTAPDPPQAIGWEFLTAGVNAYVKWAMPAQGGAGVIAEWYRSDGSQRRSAFLPADSASQTPLGYRAHAHVGTAPSAGEVQEWCFRARTVVVQGGTPEESMSDWSAAACSVRGSAGEEIPEYLPWPGAEQPPRVTDREARYLKAEGVPIILFDKVADTTCLPQLPSCIEPYDELCITDPIELDAQECDGCELLSAALARDLGFVVYRQSRMNPADTPTEFHQVSPLVDRLHCRAVLPPLGSGDDVLRDPFFKLVQFGDLTDGGGGDYTYSRSMVYIDSFPHESSREYRYELVWFDADGGIARFARTNWIRAEVP